MSTPYPLQPTLWRTCRAIANRNRLQLLGRLLRQPGQTVSALAFCLRQRPSGASESLRALEARGLLTARRVGRRVEYRMGPATGSGPVSGLVAALQVAFQREHQPLATVSKLATAFTHPRRFAIFRALKSRPRRVSEIQMATAISARALRRHLRKLQARGFVANRRGIYRAAERTDALGRELARMAGE